MLKIRIPYSGILALAVFAAFSVVPAMIAGIIAEVAIATVLFKKLTSEKEFDYDSFIGQLLLQYTMMPEVGLLSLIHLISARIVSYILVIIILNGWWLTVPVILYLSTIVHYLPKDKKLIL